MINRGGTTGEAEAVGLSSSPHCLNSTASALWSREGMLNPRISKLYGVCLDMWMPLARVSTSGVQRHCRESEYDFRIEHVWSLYFLHYRLSPVALEYSVIMAGVLEFTML